MKNSTATKLNLEAQNKGSGTTFGFAVIIMLAEAAVAAIATDLFGGMPPCCSMLIKPMEQVLAN